MANGKILASREVKVFGVGLQTFSFNNSEQASIDLATITGLNKGSIIGFTPKEITGWGLHVPFFYYNSDNGKLFAFIDSNTIVLNPKASFRVLYIVIPYFAKGTNVYAIKK